MITFIGALFALSGPFVISFYDVSLEKVVPSWTFYYAAFATFAYQTLDALDGLHARNIKACGPLGQLFDHGVDAISHGMLIVTQIEAFKMGPSLLSFLYFHGLVVYLLSLSIS